MLREGATTSASLKRRGTTQHCRCPGPVIPVWESVLTNRLLPHDYRQKRGHPCKAGTASPQMYCCRAVRGGGPEQAGRGASRLDAGTQSVAKGRPFLRLTNVSGQAHPEVDGVNDRFSSTAGRFAVPAPRLHHLCRSTLSGRYSLKTRERGATHHEAPRRRGWSAASEQRRSGREMTRSNSS